MWHLQRATAKNWTLLITLFGKGTGFDPFDFLDATQAIKPPLNLGDTDSEEDKGESDAASSITIDSVSTTVSVATSTSIPACQAQTSAIPKTPAVPQDSAPVEASHPALKPRPSWPHCAPNIDLAEACVPTSMADIHHTGIPSGVSCKRSGKTTSRGASLYICPRKDCGSAPYIGDLQGCGSHLRWVHYGTCLVCLFCPNQCYYRVSGWKSHMSAKHAQVLWFGVPEATQASLMLSAIQEGAATPDSALAPASTAVEMKISTDPLPSITDVELLQTPYHLSMIQWKMPRLNDLQNKNRSFWPMRNPYKPHLVLQLQMTEHSYKPPLLPPVISDSGAIQVT